MSGPGPGGGGGGGRPGWSPLHFRPQSPPPPRLGSPGANMFGARLPHMPCPRPRWPSPGPRTTSPLPRGASPPPMAFGPRPFRMPMHPPSPAPPMRCPSPVPPEFFRGVSPYMPDRMSPYIPGPMMDRGTPPYFGSPSRDFEYVGAGPMEHPPPPQNYEPDEDEEQGPSTAEIIANQSQDYIDEKLAEYQMTIYQLQGKQREQDLLVSIKNRRND